MKEKSKKSYPVSKQRPMVLNDAMVAEEPIAAEEPMVRTQIYLSREEHHFLQNESSRRGKPMAAVIRGFIDAQMEIPEDAWQDNPFLSKPVPDPTWRGHRGGAVNHDHFVYGTPKKWMRRNGKWVETPPLPNDYHTNSKRRQEYDAEVDRET